MTEPTFHLMIPEAGRADVLLAGMIDGLTRSAAQRWLEEGRVVLEGRPVKINARLEPGQVLSVTPPQPEAVDVIPQDIPLDVVYEDGDVIVLDMSGVDVGLMGSDNTLACVAKGARGFITNGGGIRDTDECILQKVPVWSYFASQKMDQARIRFSEKNVPVAIGGVAIYPGDVIVADGDGVIAVPRAVARDVAKFASRELHNDKNNRKAKYDVLGWAHDKTVLNDDE